MGAFLIKRILATIPVLVIVAVIVFTLIRLVPGDPAAVIAGNMATNEDIARIRTELGLDRGFFTQFGIWAKGMASGDLGQSFFFKKEVTALIGSYFPAQGPGASPSAGWLKGFEQFKSFAQQVTDMTTANSRVVGEATARIADSAASLAEKRS